MTRAMITAKGTKGTKDTKGASAPHRAWLLCVLCFLCGLCAGRSEAQPGGFAMPDPKQMAGIPRPVTDLPDGSVSVRLIRGQLSNNIADHPVELHAGSKVTTVTTDGNGRAEFKGLAPGTAVKFTADVDGEHLESQEFPAPGRGGIRLMLVATDSTKKNAAPVAAIAGTLSIGEQSRFVLQPREESVDAFYLLDIANDQTVPVNPPAPFAFDLPSDAVGAAIMEGSSPQASVKGTRVSVQGPFAPGHTFVQVASSLPALDGSIEITQKLPANLAQLAVIVKKTGETTLKSPQLKEQREMPADGEVFIAGTGGPVTAGQPIQIIVDGVPHHSQAPRRTALALAIGVVVIGTWFASRPTGDASAAAAERARLIARREKLFNELTRLERDHRAGRTDERRHAARREELVASLEAIYNALDTHEPGPDAAGGAGAAA
ncbi:MAG: hypothetical protein JWL71_4225 [Acidobacteria bacterium]|nr:hypothetical protein [Acidobacteriota bacterium]